MSKYVTVLPKTEYKKHAISELEYQEKSHFQLGLQGTKITTDEPEMINLKATFLSTVR